MAKFSIVSTDEMEESNLERHHLLKKNGTPENRITFLLSENSNCIMSQVLPAKGSMSSFKV